ncbi:MAG: D-alanyl-D-alanine carboxypeptidase/D-alanyl-D-alanine-endopeptidase [Chitinispirillaceae bacterium]
MKNTDCSDFIPKNEECGRFFRFLVIVSCLLTALPLPGTYAKSNPFQSILTSDTLVNSNVGIKVVNCSTSESIYSYNADKLFIPASVLKIITAYTALKMLTPQFNFSTEYYVADTGSDSTSACELYVKGSGDPTLTTADLNNHALRISEQVKKITDGIVVDNSYFDTIQFGSGWMWDDPNTPIAPFFINENRIDFIVSPAKNKSIEVKSVPASSLIDVSVENTTKNSRFSIMHEKMNGREKFVIAGPFSSGSTPLRFSSVIHQPELFAGTVFKELLEKNGVRVKGTVRLGSVPSTVRKIESFHSASLGDIVKKFLKQSDNLIGECILKTLGAVDAGIPGEAYNGVKVIEQEMEKIGIKSNEFRIVDGCGLSTYNLLTPRQVVSVLKAAQDDFTIYPEFSSALAVAGADGTLQRRMSDSLLIRSVRAKTGTMSGISSLAGYLRTKKGTLVAFSVMVNGFIGYSLPVRAAQDSIVKVLYENY